MKAFKYLLCAVLCSASVLGHAAQDSDIPFITPAGITVAALGDVRGKDGVLRIDNNRKSNDAFADGRGMTLYTYDKDTAGTSACKGDCAALWPAAGPVAGAKATGAWSLIKHADGAQQWAYNGKLAYTHAKDEQRGDKNGEALESGAWHVLKATATEGSVYPFGIEARDVADAGGEVLVDPESKTLYAYAGDVKQDRFACATEPCSNTWIAFTAPAIANTFGDFSIVARADGTRQWAYRGKALYKFSGDVLAEDVNGIGVDKRFQPALATRYPLPAEVAIRATPSNGKVFAAAKGMTLYRYSFYQRVQSTDELRAGPYRTAIGQAIGTQACTGACLKTWRPLLASKTAQPSWHWTILTRDEGTRQWAYRGHALYTYAEDKKPGDLMGLNIWDTAITDKDLQIVGMMTKINADNQLPSSFYWTTAYP